MTDTNTNAGSLLRDAGGARPRDELDALIERLQGFNPPDRTIASQRDYSQAIHDAAAALVQLRKENARLIGPPSEGSYGSLSYWMSSARDEQNRAERAEAEVARLKDAPIRILQLEAERDAWKSKLLAEEVEHDATMAERDALKAERDAAFALLRVCKDSVHPDTKIVIEALIT